MNDSRRDQRSFILILLLALALRVALAIFYPSIAHPDEIFQYQEPAHRWLTGLGVPTWEWRWHLRSWLLPVLVWPVMAASRFLSGNPHFYTNLLSLLLSLAALPGVAAAYRWGEQQNQKQAALITGFIAAVWFELVYFSAHLLPDTLAVDLLIPALYYGRAYRQTGAQKSLIITGVLLALTAYIRPQIAPALSIPALANLLCARHRKQLFPAAAAMALPFLALGGFDWATLGTPFQSIWYYTYVNLLKVSGDFGTSPFYWYGWHLLLVWNLALLPIGYGIYRAAKFFRIELATALAILLTMSLIAHKEARFILPAEAILLILGAAGLARQWHRHARLLLPAAAAASLALALSPAFHPQIATSHAEIKAFDQIAQDPAACGIYTLPRPSLLSYPGYTGLRDGITLRSDRFDTPAHNTAAANYILTKLKTDESLALPAGYRPLGCEPTTEGDAICTYKRDGGC